MNDRSLVIGVFESVAYLEDIEAVVINNRGEHIRLVGVDDAKELELSEAAAGSGVVAEANKSEGCLTDGFDFVPAGVDSLIDCCERRPCIKVVGALKLGRE